MSERRVRGDPGAEQGGDVRKRKLRGNLERVVLVHNDLRGVSTIRRSLLVFLGSVVREDEMILTVLLQACLAARAHPAGIHETADSGQLTDLESLNRGSDSRHASDNFMSRDHGENRTAPLVPRLMDVGVTDSAVEDFNEHIVGTWFAPRKCERFEPRG